MAHKPLRALQDQLVRVVSTCVAVIERLPVRPHYKTPSAAEPALSLSTSPSSEGARASACLHPALRC